MMRFTLRGLFAFVFCFAALGSFSHAVIRPAAVESVLIANLRDWGAEVTAVSIVPDQFSPIVDPERFQQAARIDLKTPQATVLFLKSRAKFPILESVTLVGSAVDVSTVTKVSRRDSMRRIKLDSTAVTLEQFQSLQNQRSDLHLERSNDWAHGQIDRLGQYPWHGFDNPLDIIRIVNHLRTIGKVLAIETLEGFVEHRGSPETELPDSEPPLEPGPLWNRRLYKPESQGVCSA